jgi:hypothetical protein
MSIKILWSFVFVKLIMKNDVVHILFGREIVLNLTLAVFVHIQKLCPHECQNMSCDAFW